ncbi:MAG: M15 family metallopeptidase [Clostridium sp.]|nr:M15 family metallopeptidase [Clostridium sp.]
MNKWLKPLGILVVIILFFSAMSRFLTRGETLLEYAEANPEIAYATPEKTDASTSSGELPASSGIAAPLSSADVSTTSPATSPQPDAEAILYAEGFSYQPLPDDIIKQITGVSYPVSEENLPLLSVEAVNIVSDKEDLAVSYGDLRYLKVLYYDFEGQVQTGELICNQAIARDLAEIFYELYLNEYQIEKIRLIDEYGGDDTASMLDNNTSCFNYRLVEGSSNLSKHALGLAIDINPFYNPYVVFNKNGSGETYISPKGSEIYADRSQNFPYKIDENDLCYKLFTAHGFIWGGNWNSSKDYQHFQKVLN